MAYVVMSSYRQHPVVIRQLWQIFLTDDDLYQKEIIQTDHPVSLRLTKWATMVEISDSWIGVIYSSQQSHLFVVVVKNYLCAWEFELCAAFLYDLRAIPRQCLALVAREQLYTQLSHIASPGTISNAYKCALNSASRCPAFSIRLYLYARTFWSLKQTNIKILRSYVDFSAYWEWLKISYPVHLSFDSSKDRLGIP